MGRSSISRQACVASLLSIAVLADHAYSQNPDHPFSFEDITEGSGIGFQTVQSPTIQKYLIETMVGGLALLDYDNDGRLDIYLVNGASLRDPMPADGRPDKSGPKYWNRLYRNEGNLRFVDVTDEAGVQDRFFGMGAAAADYDNDGWTDLYVTNLDRNTLFRNNGDGTFHDVTERAGVSAGGWSAAGAFFDYDNNGHLDLFVSRYLDWGFSGNPWCGDKSLDLRTYCHPDEFGPVSHLLYRNNGDGTFTDVSVPSGIAEHPGKGLGVALGDYDLDGRIDVFVANDSFPQQLFHNLGDGTFAEDGVLAGVAYNDDGKTFAGMGTAFTDYDNNGFPDIFVNSLPNQKYALFRNSDGIFEDDSRATGLAAASRMHSGWGAGLADFDNDGWKDLLVAQSHVMDNIEELQSNLRYREPLLVLRNRTGRFIDVTKQSGAAVRVSRAARGAAFGDLDNDGRVDVVLSVNGEAAVLLRNTSRSAHHWLSVELTGSRSNRDGVGTRLRIVGSDGQQHHSMVSPAGSYLSSNDKRVHFGVGASDVIKTLEIRWPSGVVQLIENVKPDQILKLSEPVDGELLRRKTP